ncbi:hypothetical protein ACNITQ_23290, partial [Escherichia coli]
SLKTSIKTITYLSDTGCLEIQGASLLIYFIINNSFISSLCSSLTQETEFRKGITLEKCSLRHNVFYEGFRGVS